MPRHLRRVLLACAGLAACLVAASLATTAYLCIHRGLTLDVSLGPGWAVRVSLELSDADVAPMALPTAWEIHDDVQYFPPGPDFPWMSTPAATAEARVRELDIDAPASDDDVAPASLPAPESPEAEAKPKAQSDQGKAR